MKNEYITRKNGGYYIADSRVSLDSVVYAFREGKSPESIRWSFPVLTLEEVYGAVAFYLANQAKIDKYLIESEIKFEKEAAIRRAQFRKENPELYKRLVKARSVLAR
ncbi:MAG TPA: DUF433 domain-containing protein [Pyrinomonadaceae bacterium]|nr:DUF433 domain-containing protein [Pyrinomonadaceae bacterium]